MDKVCGNCKWWEEVDGLNLKPSGNGMCNNSKVEGVGVVMDINYCNSAEPLFNKDFGCIHFEPKSDL